MGKTLAEEGGQWRASHAADRLRQRGLALEQEVARHAEASASSG